jgi:hypothetical protein
VRRARQHSTAPAQRLGFGRIDEGPPLAIHSSFARIHQRELADDRRRSSKHAVGVGGEIPLGQKIEAVEGIVPIRCSLVGLARAASGIVASAADSAVLDPLRMETHCLAGQRGLELRNVVAKYPFERSHRFPGIQPNAGHRDYTRLSCGVEDTQTFSLLALVLRFGRFWLLPRRPVGMRGLSGPFPISQRLAHIQTILRWSSCAETADGSGILVPVCKGHILVSRFCSSWS